MNKMILMELPLKYHYRLIKHISLYFLLLYTCIIPLFLPSSFLLLLPPTLFFYILLKKTRPEVSFPSHFYHFAGGTGRKG